MATTVGYFNEETSTVPGDGKWARADLKGRIVCTATSVDTGTRLVHASAHRAGMGNGDVLAGPVEIEDPSARKESC